MWQGAIARVVIVAMVKHNMDAKAEESGTEESDSDVETGDNITSVDSADEASDISSKNLIEILKSVTCSTM